MAKQKGNTITREEGDSCPRELCGGKLRLRSDGMMECDVCHFNFNVSYQLGQGGNREGKPPVIVPDSLILEYAKAHHAFMMEVADEVAPSPGGNRIDPAKSWNRLTSENRQKHYDEAKRIMEKFWPNVVDYFMVNPPGENVTRVENNKAAEELRALLTEIAIPSLRYCEDKYGHDNMARLNLEAGIGL